MEIAIVIVALLALFGFRQWLRHQRRVLVHKERLAAIEKGIELPPLQEEQRQAGVNVQRLLLFGGLVWMAIGIGALAVLSVVLADPLGNQGKAPWGLSLVGLIPILVGMAHLITYYVDRKGRL
ncbi:MAG: hypothetical protein HYR60_11495 [Acidobacteria bacterium]|nr:hypothetical protein [Acidobacteriota bacterium]MBI3474075.1 hypothetical protein [Candidatus Solibacter usitatus]